MPPNPARPSPRRPRPPNTALIRLIEAGGASRKALAHRVNELSREAGSPTEYTHTSVANWCRRGMIPKAGVPLLLARALGERLGRQVHPAEIGMAGACPSADPEAGLGFPRETEAAVREATAFWRTVNRRGGNPGPGFAPGAFSVPVTRWLVSPADAEAGTAPTAASTGLRVGRADLVELREAAEEARRWDSKYGGGSWRAESVTTCLEQRAVPLLEGRSTEAVGRELFAVTAELSRLAGWTAFDTGRHHTAQRHFIQALRLARAGSDIQLGCYVLSTMALQSLLRGGAEAAVDMAQGAYERAAGCAAPRVLAFARLIEARAHARRGDERAASAALGAAEDLIDAPSTRPEPHWIDFFDRARLAADATEIHRDLGRPDEALGWNAAAAAMPAGRFTRSTGIRHAVLATVHLRSEELELALESGHRAVTGLARVSSPRALDYLAELTVALQRRRREPAVRELLHRARTELPSAA
jgi:tetratricopeptide (TPR) repeat protein